MSRQADLFGYPSARWSDPETSRLAAESIPLAKVSKLQEQILAVLRIAGPCSDEELEDRLRDYYPELRASSQSIRSRRAELVKRGLAVATDQTGTTRYGRACTIWRAA